MQNQVIPSLGLLLLLLLLLLAICLAAFPGAISSQYRVIDTKSPSADKQTVFVTLDAGQYATHTGPVNPDILIALGEFYEDTNETGWAYFNVIAHRGKSSTYNDSQRAYAAGIAEGYLTSDMINLHYLNRVKGYCEQDPAYCSRLKTFLAENVKWMAGMVQTNRNTSSFWHQVGLFMEQLAGIADGVSGKFLGPRLNLSGDGLENLYLSNMHGDIDDLEHVLHKAHIFSNKRQGAGCSAIVKVASNGDLLAGHATWINYKSMLRVIKYHQLDVFPTAKPPAPNDSFIAKVKVTSYPGYITSLDDFYINSNKLAIFETFINNYNTTLWNIVTPIGTVPSAIRSVVATRLARSGEEWHKIFQQFNSGTGNNEWTVVDYDAWSSHQAEGIVTVSNQLPGNFFVEDVTSRLMTDSYFASYNVPAIEAAFNLSNQTGMVQSLGNYFSYNQTSRALIFKARQSQVVDVKTAVQLLRYNDFKNDPLSACSTCNPPYSAALTVAARYDLNERNGTYPIDFLGGWDSMGATDVKVVNGTLMNSMAFVSQSSPTFDQQPAFQWSTSGMSMEEFPHYGQPDLFKFDPVIYK